MLHNLLEKYRYGVSLPADAGGGGGPDTSTPNTPASTPSPAPSPSAPSEPSTTPSGAKTSAGEAFDFGSIFEEPKDSVEVLTSTEAPPGTDSKPGQPKSPKEPLASEQPSSVPPAKEAAPAAKVEPAKEAPDQSKPPATAEPSPYIDPYDPAILSQHLAQNEAQAMALVADKMFALSPEDKEAIETDVIGTIPKLLARVFVKSQQNVLQQMGRMIPVMMQRHLQAVERNTGNESKFYARWPDIKADKHGESVRKYAAVYRQMHPQATLEQMIEDLGPMIMMANKIVPSIGAPGAVPGQPARPAAPMSPANGRSPPPAPFAPAGAGPTTQPRQVEMAAWEAMFNQPDG